MNHFYRLWHDAERGKNEYVPTEVHWTEVPGRDEKWKAQTIANTSEQQFKIEFECLSGETLIDICDNDNNIQQISMENLYAKM
jgi:hypothetical protein